MAGEWPSLLLVFFFFFLVLFFFSAQYPAILTEQAKRFIMMAIKNQERTPNQNTVFSSSWPIAESAI